MMNDRNKSAEERINAWALEYVKASGVQKVNLKMQISEKISDLFSGQQKEEEQYEAAIDLIYPPDEKKSILEKYDGSKPFSYYLKTAVKNRILDHLRKSSRELLILNEMVKNENDNEDTEQERADLQKDYSNMYEKVDHTQEIISILTVFLPLISQYDTHFNGRKNNRSAQRYYQLFYTERITAICKEASAVMTPQVYHELKNQEMMIFKSVNIDFADHVLEEKSRTIKEISETKYKKNEYFGIQQSPKERIKAPFKANVYKTYFEYFENVTVTDATISQRRKDFDSYIRKFMH